MVKRHLNLSYSHPVSRSLALILMLLSALACKPSRAEKELFHDGRDLVTQGQYDEALQSLQEYLDAYPGGAFASRAWLFIGKAHMASNRHEESKTAFDTCIARFPDSLEAHKSRYKLALLDLLEGNRASATEGFRRLAANPNGPLAAEASAMARYLARPPAESATPPTETGDEP